MDVTVDPVYHIVSHSARLSMTHKNVAFKSRIVGKNTVESQSL